MKSLENVAHSFSNALYVCHRMNGYHSQPALDVGSLGYNPPPFSRRQGLGNREWHACASAAGRVNSLYLYL